MLFVCATVLRCIWCWKTGRLPSLWHDMIKHFRVFMWKCFSLVCFFQIDHYAQRDLKKGLQLFGTEGNVGLTNAWMIVQTDVRTEGWWASFKVVEMTPSRSQASRYVTFWLHYSAWQGLLLLSARFRPSVPQWSLTDILPLNVKVNRTIQSFYERTVLQTQNAVVCLHCVIML